LPRLRTFLYTVFTIGLCTCAQSKTKEISRAQTTQPDKQLSQSMKPENHLDPVKPAKPGGNQAIDMPNELQNNQQSSRKTYWVREVNTLVYNGAHDVVRSLRLQPKVLVLLEKQGWGLIDPDKDEWVKLEGLTTERPKHILARPQESTGLPKNISLPD